MLNFLSVPRAQTLKYLQIPTHGSEAMTAYMYQSDLTYQKTVQYLQIPTHGSEAMTAYMYQSDLTYQKTV